MNKITILAISAVFVASILAISAFEVEAVKPQAQSVACPAENVQHWANYHFKASGTITHPTLPSFGGSTVLEIQVPADETYSDHGVIVAKLTELGYLDATSQPLVTSDIFEPVASASSMICAEN